MKPGVLRSPAGTTGPAGPGVSSDGVFSRIIMPMESNMIVTNEKNTQP